MPKAEAKRSTGTGLLQEADRGVRPLLANLLCLFLGWLACLSYAGASPAPPPPSQAPSISLDDVQILLNDLLAITEDLNKAVKSYGRHLDEDIAKYDRGPGSADAGVTGGDARIAQTAIRKAFAIRGLASTNGDREDRPGFVADLKEIQNLILAARQRIDDSDAVNGWLLVVSPHELNSGEAKAKKVTHMRLQKAREAAKAAATRALAELPIPLPEDSALTENFFDGAFTGRAVFPQHPAGPSQEKAIETAVTVLPLHWEPGKLTTLMAEPGYRMALADLGMDNPKGRSTFYLEEWVQRGSVVLRMGRLAGVDPSSGKHFLIKRYPVREVPGRLEDVYSLAGLNETRYARPPDNEPSRDEVESVLAEVARLNEVLPAARQRYISALGTGLARSDRRLLDKGGSSLDTGLPEEMRVQLYAIRGHLLHAALVLEAENNLRGEARNAEKQVDQLKRLAAWANRFGPEEPSPATPPASEWDRLQIRADDTIYVSRKAIAATLAALPPDLSDHNAKFPELSKNSIVHMVGVRASRVPGVAIWQEVWDLDSPATNRRRARQEIDIVVVDPATGDQIRVSHQAKYYPVERNETLQDAYERLGGPVAPPMEVTVPPDF